jgi:hypothetical protein
MRRPSRGTWNSLDADPCRSNYGLLSFIPQFSFSLFPPTFPVTSFLYYQAVQALKVYCRILVCFTSGFILFVLYTDLTPVHSFKLLSKLRRSSYIQHEDQQRGACTPKLYLHPPFHGDWWHLLQKTVNRSGYRRDTQTQHSFFRKK